METEGGSHLKGNETVEAAKIKATWHLSYGGFKTKTQPNTIFFILPAGNTNEQRIKKIQKAYVT